MTCICLIEFLMASRSLTPLPIRFYSKIYSLNVVVFITCLSPIFSSLSFLFVASSYTEAAPLDYLSGSNDFVVELLVVAVESGLWCYFIGFCLGNGEPEESESWFVEGFSARCYCRDLSEVSFETLGNLDIGIPLDEDEAFELRN